MGFREAVVGTINKGLDALNRRRQKKVAPVYNEALAAGRDLEHLEKNPGVIAKGAKSGRTHRVVEKSMKALDKVGGVDKTVANRAYNISRKADDVVNLGMPGDTGYVTSKTTKRMFDRSASFRQGHDEAKLVPDGGKAASAFKKFQKILKP